MPGAAKCSQLAPTALFSILSLGKLFLREKTLAARSDKQKLGKAHSGKRAGCIFHHFIKHEWMGQTEDKFGSALKEKELTNLKEQLLRNI